MLDALKSCPFCGSERAHAIPANRKSTERLYPVVRCAGCFTEVPGKNDDFSLDCRSAIAAWNRRALQAVGPEPAVAVKWEQLSEIINAAVKVAIRTGSDFHIDADKLAEFAGSALVAIPPAERVVEALPPTREYVDRIVRIFRDRPADDTSAVVLHDYARAALSGSGSGWPVPDGWKLVPVEPDDAMIEAGQDTCEEKNSWGGRVYASDIWESMLAASPTAPQQGGE